MLNEASCKSLEGSVDRNIVCREGKSSYRVKVYSSKSQCCSFQKGGHNCGSGGNNCVPQRELYAESLCLLGRMISIQKVTCGGKVVKYEAKEEQRVDPEALVGT